MADPVGEAAAEDKKSKPEDRAELVVGVARVEDDEQVMVVVGSEGVEEGVEEAADVEVVDVEVVDVEEEEVEDEEIEPIVDVGTLIDGILGLGELAAIDDSSRTRPAEINGNL